LEYLWYWLTLFGSFVLYIPLFLLHFQWVEPGEQWYAPKCEVSSYQAGGPAVENVVGAIPIHSADVLSRKNAKLWSTILRVVPLMFCGALLMLQTRYPILYCVLVLPLTVVRFMGFHEQHVTGRTHRQPVATFIVINLFTLSGVFNALLYRLTRASFFQSQLETGPPSPPPIREHMELGVMA
jgi:hypothetical protein